MHMLGGFDGSGTQRSSLGPPFGLNTAWLDEGSRTGRANRDSRGCQSVRHGQLYIVGRII